jgi:hypothetical protein
MELYQHYFILFLIDCNDQLTFISNTDPIIYTPDIKCSKLYENEVNVDNDILTHYSRIDSLIKNTNIVSFYKGYIEKDLQTGNIEIVWRDRII